MITKNMSRLIPHSSHDYGVSPVVGVMLMLVVTIIIAALVSSFASGLASTNEPAPTVSLGVSLYNGILEKKAVIENLAGDSLPTHDLQIVMSYTVPERYLGVDLPDGGKVITHTIDGGLDPVAENNLITDIGSYPFTPQVTNNNDTVTNRTVNGLFGTAILVPGSRLYFNIDYFLGFNTTLGRTAYGFDSGSSLVHVSIFHTPSGKLIYDKDVRVE